MIVSTPASPSLSKNGRYGDKLVKGRLQEKCLRENPFRKLNSNQTIEGSTLKHETEVFHITAPEKLIVTIRQRHHFFKKGNLRSLCDTTQSDFK